MTSTVRALDASTSGFPEMVERNNGMLGLTVYRLSNRNRTARDQLWTVEEGQARTDGAHAALVVDETARDRHTHRPLRSTGVGGGGRESNPPGRLSHPQRF